MNERDELRRKLQELLPRREDLHKRTEAQRQGLEELRTEIGELHARLAARTGNSGLPPWSGALEPLVLAAAFLERGGDVGSIVIKVTELSSKPYPPGSIRFAIHRLVHRKLLSEDDRTFTVTPEGERELARARHEAKRWIGALGDWPGPQGDGE